MIEIYNIYAAVFTYQQLSAHCSLEEEQILLQPRELLMFRGLLSTLRNTGLDGVV